MPDVLICRSQTLFVTCEHARVQRPGYPPHCALFTAPSARAILARVGDPQGETPCGPLTWPPSTSFSAEAFGPLMYEPIAARAKHGQAPPEQASW